MTVAPTPLGGASVGYRRSYSKGLCRLGIFESTSNASAVYEAQLLTKANLLVVDRFNPAAPDPWQAGG